ncbi:hypothetical protein G6011_11605 [Alternaria panax]|uniref:Uncharacterized protein n=1 Tax=Alternaria panax TaxID=48097 RepID=A0AAD4IEC2_9PLEO|nr:hypothetical protein G6011_11605 [Alternaria panax]
MIEPEAGILRLATELRQMIYDYIISATQTELSRQEVPFYLFQYFTFVLTDSERTCYSIVAAFCRILSPKNLVCVRKIAIPCFTIRGLFDPARSGSLQKNPYVLKRLDPKDDNSLTSTQQNVLRQDLCSALSLLNSMPALKNLELGVDVIEFIWYASSNGFGIPSAGWFLRLLSTFKWAKRLPLTHPLLAALHLIKGMGKLRQVELKLKWCDFVVNSYRKAGFLFPLQWTQTVKEEMERLFEDLLHRETGPRWISRDEDEQILILT